MESIESFGQDGESNVSMDINDHRDEHHSTESTERVDLVANNDDKMDISADDGYGHYAHLDTSLGVNSGSDFDSEMADDDNFLATNSDSEIRGFDADSNSNSSDIDSDMENLDGSLLSADLEDEIHPFFAVPDCVKDLRTDLLQEYCPPTSPPPSPFSLPPLDPSEKLTLKHYIAWSSSNGTVKAYKNHAQVLEDASDVKIFSLYHARKLAFQLTNLHPTKVDMCPNSCIAYTGAYKDLDCCPYVHPTKKTICGKPRFKPSSGYGKSKASAQFIVLPVLATIQAMFANVETSRLLRARDNCLKQVLDLFGKATTGGSNQDRKFSDFSNGMIHTLHYTKLGLFQEERDIALGLSTDGAQLTMKKQSNTWILILILFNLPPEIRYKSRNIIINFATPGPNSPGDIESFIRPLFEEMARAGSGIWIWDAIDSSYFLNHMHIVMVLGDMLGSAKLNGMAGHSAIFGDRFSGVQGARATRQKGSKAQYYPMEPPNTELYNPFRPKKYNIANLPLRKQENYWRTLEYLSAATSKTDRTTITKNTGISRMPLCAGSLSFIHPSYFPLDPFHLIYENCMAFMWDTWTVGSDPSEPIYLAPETVRAFGELIPLAMKTLPPSFCGLVRDPFLKRQSQFKIYEWMSLLHWYILPIGIELGFNPSLLNNFSQFVAAMEFAMTIKARSIEDIYGLHSDIQEFLMEFESLYVAGVPENVNRCRLCIFQLIHIPIHIQWYGSIRIGSQATVERSIGEMGHKIRSKKAVFANLVNIIIERELVRVLSLYYPSLQPTPKKKAKHLTEAQLFQKIRIAKRDIPRLVPEFLAIKNFLHSDLSTTDLYSYLTQYGKFKHRNGRVLRSRISELRSSSARHYRWFEADSDPISTDSIFGEALAFYKFQIQDHVQMLMVYHRLQSVQKTLRVVIRGKWPVSKNIEVIDVSRVVDVVGIWCISDSRPEEYVYILRKHPGLEMLNPEECGVDSDGSGDESDEY